MRFFFLIICSLVLLGGGYFYWVSKNLEPQKTVIYAPPKQSLWNFQAIDTMKYSRDMAREKLHDTSFDAVIERQIGAIADTGATHVALATPYDEEFVPFLTRWVAVARAHHLRVWFRGNWSGWEGWFNYPRITREEHWDKTRAFIEHHPELFADGDAFSACPECENGGPGDPRQTGDVMGHRNFLIAEYKMMQKSFHQMNKNVRTDLFSMNGDVARLVMDSVTTQALGGIVTIDHYVKSPEQLVRDVEEIAKKSGGKVILGEFGAPIPDIHGSFTDTEQAQWVDRVLGLLEQSSSVEGVNYWLSVGGSTEIWRKGGNEREAVSVLQGYFKPNALYGFIRDELGRSVAGAHIVLGSKQVVSDKEGHYVLLYRGTGTLTAEVEANGYLKQTQDITSRSQEQNIILIKQNKDWHFRLLDLAY